MQIKTGTLVRVKKPLSKFDSIGRVGIIDHNYAEHYGGGGSKSYAVRFFDDNNISAWYTARNLEVLDTENLYSFKNKKLYLLQEVDKKSLLKKYC